MEDLVEGNQSHPSLFTENPFKGPQTFKGQDPVKCWWKPRGQKALNCKLNYKDIWGCFEEAW